MPNTIDTLEDDSQVSSVLESDASELLKTGQLDSRFAAPRRKPLPRWVFVGLALVFAATAGLSWWLHARHFESTDDAQIDGHINVVSSRISGTVLYVNPQAENNQYVQAGTLLLELDPNDYQAALDHAKSDLATKEGEARSAGVNVPITNATAFSQLRLAEAAHEEAIAAVDSEEANLATAQHRVQQDEAVYSRAERDRVRWQGLVDGGVVSRSEYDAREAEALADGQQLEADRATVTAEQHKIAQARSLIAQRAAQVESARTAPRQLSDARAKSESSMGQVNQAQADVHIAELNLGYTKIYAPVSGVIGRKTVELGQRIQPGQSLLAIVPVDDIWVTADFKETQLKYMRPRQPVKIHVDTFGRDYQGTVENLPGAAGTLFSLLPPENASGNFVKVVQRLPVRIRFNPDQDPQHLLRPGMSVEPQVTVR
ncbi:MAG: HlyD family secretion protein [Acidobacteriales bacterium]|nr:HlyD family secretion protein [Terriglobales bacterium]